MIEIFKSCGEVFEILEQAKKDSVCLQATNGGQGLDPNSMVDLLFKDKHFMNSKQRESVFLNLFVNIVLGDFLNKRPGAKKVEIFMAKHLQ